MGRASQFFPPVWLFCHSTLSEHAQLIFNYSNMANFRKAAVKIAQKKYEDCDSDLSNLELEVDFSDTGQRWKPTEMEECSISRDEGTARESSSPTENPSLSKLAPPIPSQSRPRPKSNTEVDVPCEYVSQRITSTPQIEKCVKKRQSKELWVH